MVSLSANIYVFLSIGCGIVLAFKKFAGRSQGRLPPSPPGDPIIGHGRLIPLNYSWKTFAAWGRKYGDVVYVHVFGRPIVILNSATVARDILEKKSANFSDRPPIRVHGDMIGMSACLPFLPYGDRFRRQRRLIQQFFSQQAIPLFRPIQEKEVMNFMSRLLKSPDAFLEHVLTLVASSVLMVTYGHQVTSHDDPYIKLVETLTVIAEEAGPVGGTVIDIFPLLRHIPEWFPFATIKRSARRARQVNMEIMNLPLKEVLAQKNAGDSSNESFLSHLLEDFESKKNENLEYEEDIKALSTITYAAGVDTSVGTIRTFILMMVLHPESAERAQREIDAVIGSERLPTLDDRPSLPYIDCILKEVLRINAVVPLSIPHRSTRIDKYNGWTIPEGTMIIPNIWQMMNDGDIFPNPEVFSPERYMGKCIKEEKAEKYDNEKPNREDDPSNLAFGFGRRICPGRHFADALVWTTIAQVLALFDVRPFVDPISRAPSPPECIFLSGMSSQPKPFKCSIAPRSVKHAALVQQQDQHY